MQKIYYKVSDRPDEQINAFKNRYELVSEEQIKEVFKVNGYKLESLEKSSSWGTAHIIYYAKIKGRNSRLVFRSNSGKKGGFNSPEIVMLSEKIITDIVSTLGVKTNKILYVDISRKDFPFDYQIEEELIGVDPEKYIDKQGNFLDTKEDYERLSYELGQSIAKYSETKFSSYGLFNEGEILNGNIVGTNTNFYDYITTNLDIHLRFLLVNKVINNDILCKIISIFENYRELINDCDSCLVHHDLADHNLIYNPERKGLGAIFDWEAMVLGDPMLDLGSCHTWGTHYPRKQKLIEGYKSIKDLPNDYEIRMNLYELRTWLWKIMFAIRMNFDKILLEKWITNMNLVLQKF